MRVLNIDSKLITYTNNTHFRCRWSNGDAECNGACAFGSYGAIPFELSSACLLTYTGDKNSTNESNDSLSCQYYPICVQLEDYYPSSPTTRLSSASLQFIVQVCPNCGINCTNSIPLVADNCGHSSMPIYSRLCTLY